MTQASNFMSQLAKRLNQFFSKMSHTNFKFQSVFETQESNKSKCLKKAYRIFKAKNLQKNQEPNQKEKQQITIKWDQMTQDDKLKYYENHLKEKRIVKPRGKKKQEIKNQAHYKDKETDLKEQNINKIEILDPPNITLNNHSIEK